MSVEMINVSDGVLTFRFSGKLKLSELQAMQKTAGDAIDKNGKVRVLCMTDDFLGWEKSGGWGDVSFQAQYDPFIEKIAIVGDRKWEELTLLFTSKGIRRVPIEYFPPSDLAKGTGLAGRAAGKVVMKIRLHRSHLQFRAQRCFRAASEHDCFVEPARGLRQAWPLKLIWKFRAAIALVGVIALPILSADAQTPAASAAPPAATPVPPPAAPAKLGSAELEKLLMPIALYSDSLIATLLPACVYPLEIVQAARFLQDPNNASKIDEQPWDESVKAIAKVPAALKKLNDDLQWTIQLGEVFLNQDKDVMDMIQSLRSKAQKAGTLRTTEQQVVVVTNMIVEKTVEERVVVVTNTVVQIQPSPANPQVVYVPTYPPTVYAPPPSYVYDPYAPLIAFGAGVAVGAILANNCDWGHGGCYYGGGGNYNAGHNTKIKVEGDVNIGSGNRNTVGSGNRPSQQPGRGGQGGQKWQPDANRVRSSGSPGSAKTMESRGWSGSSGAGGARASTQPAAGNRGGGAGASARPSTPSAGARPSTPSASTRPSTPSASASARPSTPSASTRPSTPSASPSAGTANRSAAGAGSPSASPSATRSSGSSAFGGGGGGGGAADRQVSQRGASSRGGGMSGGGASRGGGGGSRGGGGRGR